MSSTKNVFDLKLLSSQISEIKDDSPWSGEDVKHLDKAVISEMIEGDEKPMFVEFVALHEGVSNNHRHYTDEAVKSCVDAMVGVNMYKGHEEPGTQSWRYREPVGKVIAAKLTHVDVGGKRVLAAKGKAYITEADQKLRSDIRKKMAGPVSVLGNARQTREFGNPVKVVHEIHKPLKSIDFCNPGTSGMPLAGVTAVVQEMTEDQNQEPEDKNMTKTKEQLMAEHPQVFSEVVSEMLDTQLKEIAKTKSSLTNERDAFEAEKKSLNTQIQEMTAAKSDLEKRIVELEKQLQEERAERAKAELTAFAQETIAEMRANDKFDADLVDLAATEIEAQFDGDLDKSKQAYKAKLEKAYEKVNKISEMYGGQKRQPQNDDTGVSRHSGNPKPKSGKSSLKKILAPSLAEKIKE